MPRTSKPKSKRFAKKRVAKRTNKKRSTNVPEYASMSCKSTLTNPGTPSGLFNGNTLYSQNTTCLNLFPRAKTAGTIYQHFRIKNVKLTWKPMYDSFVSSGGTSSKPNLYYMIDKSGSIPSNVSLEGLKNMGAKPKALDERPISVSWAPSVLQGALQVSGTIVPAKYTISPWLSTDNAPFTPAFQASLINHLGIYWYMDQTLAIIGDPYVYTMELEVQFEFKKPLVEGLTSEIPAVGAELATLNHSPDGIVGGGDGV